MRLFPLVFALTFATPALAVPLQLTHQGRLNDSAGTPLVGTHQLTVSVFAEASGGSPLWTDTLSTELVDGVFSMVLGSSAAPLDSALFDGSVRWVAIAVDGGVELPQRLALVSVPYSVRAGSAAEADRLSAPLAWAEISGAPADEDTLGALSCTDGQVPTWQGSDWVCASPVPASVDVGSLSGTIDIDNLPVGTSGTSVAAGDHTHSFSQITGELGLDRTNGGLDLGARTTGNLDVSRVSGNLPLSQTTGNLDIGRTTGNIPYARLPVGTLANTVAAGNHTHTAADVGALPASGGTVSGALGVNGVLSPTGGLRLGDLSAACSSSGEVGLLRLNTNGLELCTDAGWQLVWGARDGSSAAQAVESCKVLHAERPALPDGTYWLDPDGTRARVPFRAWCDMTNQGGGWTLVAHKNAAASNIEQSAAVGTPGRPFTEVTHHKLLTTDIDALQAVSDNWAFQGDITNKRVHMNTTGAPVEGLSLGYTYGDLRGALTGVGMSGCGANRWTPGVVYPVDNVIPNPSCWAYPTTSNFYDFKSNPSGGNGRSMTIWLK